MRARRILILYKHGLLAEGLRSLLEADERLEIISVVGDLAETSALVQKLGPDAVVVEGDKFSLSLGDPPGVRLDCVPLVISVAENENRMCIYRVQEREVADLQELIETLTG